MRTTHDLRSVIRAELDCDDQRIDQLLHASRRAGARTGARHDEADALVTMWLQHRDPAHYAGSRGPHPRDPIMRAMEIEAARQSAQAVDWDPVTPGSIAAAEMLTDMMASAWMRGRRCGTRPQVERRSTGRQERSYEAGQASFGGFGWGMPA